RRGVAVEVVARDGGVEAGVAGAGGRPIVEAAAEAGLGPADDAPRRFAELAAVGGGDARAHGDVGHFAGAGELPGDGAGDGHDAGVGELRGVGRRLTDGVDVELQE